MKFLDKRADKTKPVDKALLRVRDLIVEKNRKNPHFENCCIMLCDYDPKIGNRVHLQMNFEPQVESGWISEAISIILLENTAWKRYAVGVWINDK